MARDLEIVWLLMITHIVIADCHVLTAIEISVKDNWLAI
jgi:hypothetical protein